MTEENESGRTENEPEKKDPAEEARIRVDGLKADIAVLEKEIKILEGKVRNRDPHELSRLRKETDVLRKRWRDLEKALHALLSDALAARQTADLEAEAEILRAAAVEYFKNAGIDEGVWKDIGS